MKRILILGIVQILAACSLPSSSTDAQSQIDEAVAGTLTAKARVFWKDCHLFIIWSINLIGVPMIASIGVRIT